MKLKLCLLIILMFYVWTATVGRGDFQLYVNHPSYYALLTDAFLAGKPHLLIEPSPQLLALSDPYDPNQNGPYRLHDASLYKGKYYLYFGITPVLTLLLPYKLITGNNMPDGFAIFFFSFGGFLWSVAFLLFLQRKYFQEVKEWKILLSIVVLGFANVAPFLLRFIAVYDVAISCGLFFLTGALYLFSRAFSNSNLSISLIILGSLFLGLASGARPHFIVVGAIVVGTIVLLVYLKSIQQKAGLKARIKTCLALLTPFALCLVLIVAYNYSRFDNPFEFGSSYQLAAEDYRHAKKLDFRRIGPGLYFYLMQKPTINIHFPYFHLFPSSVYLFHSNPSLPTPPEFPIPVPAPYRLEKVVGVFTGIPFTLLIIIGALFYFKRISLGSKNLHKIIFPIYEFSILMLTAVSSIIIVSLLFGATMRYVADFATLLILGSCIIWFYFDSVLDLNSKYRMFLKYFSIVTAICSILFGISFSITGYYDELRGHNLQEYEKIESWFKPLSMVLSKWFHR